MEWVKCRERLPEKEGRFCVRLTNGCISTDYYTPDDSQDNPQGKWKYYLVSEWMTLPEAYYPRYEDESAWKRIYQAEDIVALPEGYYFVTIGDLVYVAVKSENNLRIRQSRVPFADNKNDAMSYDLVDAVMSIPIHSENNKLNLF